MPRKPAAKTREETMTQVSTTVGSSAESVQSTVSTAAPAVPTITALAQRLARVTNTLVAPPKQVASDTKNSADFDRILQAVSKVAKTSLADKLGGKAVGVDLSDAPTKVNAKGVKGRFDGAAGITHLFSDSVKGLPVSLPYAAKEGIDAAVSGKLSAAVAAQGAGIASKSSLFSGAVENHSSMPVFEPTKKRVPLEKRSTIGGKWFNMAAHEITPEIKKDLLILRNREYLDPKRHYKGAKTELSGSMPRFFAVGTVQEAPNEHATARLTRKERKPTLVAALLADERFKQYAKKQTAEVQRKGVSTHYEKRKGRPSSTHSNKFGPPSKRARR